MNADIEKVRAAVDAHREQHTAGELRAGKPSDAIVSDEPAGHACNPEHLDYYGGHLVAESVEPSNRRRIIACWNACTDLPTDMLEQVPFVAPARVSYRIVTGERDALKTARDDLLDVLTNVLEFVEEREDADCVDGRFVGNRAMSLAQALREALAKHTPKATT